MMSKKNDGRSSYLECPDCGYTTYTLEEADAHEEEGCPEQCAHCGKEDCDGTCER